MKATANSFFIYVKALYFRITLQNCYFQIYPSKRQIN